MRFAITDQPEGETMMGSNLLAIPLVLWCSVFDSCI